MDSLLLCIGEFYILIGQVLSVWHCLDAILDPYISHMLIIYNVVQQLFFFKSEVRVSTAVKSHSCDINQTNKSAQTDLNIL